MQRQDITASCHTGATCPDRADGGDRGEAEGGEWLRIPELRQEYRYPRYEFSPCILSVGLSSVLVSRCTPLRHPIDRRGIGRATRGHEQRFQKEGARGTMRP